MLYGKLNSEQLAEENLKCRQIIREITNLQVNDRQIWRIMYGLALELENNEDMKMITDFIKDYKGSTLFLASQDEE